MSLIVYNPNVKKLHMDLRGFLAMCAVYGDA